MLLREEVLLGRHGERPGEFRQRIRITRDDRPLYDQELGAGPPEAGWDGPAVFAAHRCAGSVLLVDPDATAFPEDTSPAAARPMGAALADAAVMNLPGPAVLVTALAASTAMLCW